MSYRPEDPSSKKKDVIVSPETQVFSLKKETDEFDTGEWFVPTDPDSDVFADASDDVDAAASVPVSSEESAEEGEPNKRADALTVVIIAAIVALILMVVTATIILLVTTMGPKKIPSTPADADIVTTTTLAQEGAVSRTTTTTVTTSTTTTTTTMRSQNGRVICSTCSYVYGESADHCPACANEGVSCDSICPTCQGAHNTEEGQAWEFCSFCASYFVVTDGEVHTCKQCGTSGLTPQEVDPVSGKCDNCKNSKHHCSYCNALCDASLTYKNKMTCSKCYSYAVKNVCPHCNKPVSPESEMCTNCLDGFPNLICPSCGIGRFETGVSASGAYCQFCGTKMV